MFRIKTGPLVRRRRCIADPNVVLDKPFVDCLRRMRSQNSTFKIGLAQDVWES